MILALKGISHTVDPNALVSSLLLFGVLPSFPIPEKHSLQQKKDSKH